MMGAKCRRVVSPNTAETPRSDCGVFVPSLSPIDVASVAENLSKSLILFGSGPV
jgi:hypothetical protein